jgi:predicted dehydrogenase
MIRVGIIGLGMMGGMHYRAWREIGGVEVVAVADADPRRAAGDLSTSWSNLPGAAKQLDMSGIRGTTNPRKLIAMGEVDLVDVCVPTPAHARLAVAALKAGKHCVCEKPLARTARQARQIAAAAHNAKGFCLPAMCVRFWPQWAWLAEAVRGGQYGKVLDANFRRVGSMPPGWFADGRLSGGAILDLHLHDTDFVKFAFGKPEAVQSFGRVGKTGCIDQLVTHYMYGDGGPVVTAEGSWAMSAGFPFRMDYTVNFERATAEYVMLREQPLVIYQDGQATPHACEGADGYHNELAYMARCVATGEAPSIITAADAAESIEIVEAEARSIRTGRRVKV